MLSGGQTNRPGSGLSGLIAKFEQAGLGGVAQSWVGNGANQPVSAQQLNNVFGEQQVQGMASKAGMQPGDFLSQLSRRLPNAVNAMTPDGRAPSEKSMSV